MKYKISCAFYHGELAEKKREANQTKWMEEKIKVIVATSAFGLGINKENVRFVIHYSMPKSLENYIQECGRAGRDGKPSKCIMYYTLKDKRVHEFLILVRKGGECRIKQFTQANIYKIIDYCEEQYICRRKIQLEYLGESFSTKECNGGCDNCAERKQKGSYIELQNEATDIVNFVREITKNSSKITLIQAVDLLKGKNSKKSIFLSQAAKEIREKLKSFSKKRLTLIFNKLLLNRGLREDIIQVSRNVVSYLGVGKRATDIESRKIKIRITVPKEQVPETLPDISETQLLSELDTGKHKPQFSLHSEEIKIVPGKVKLSERDEEDLFDRLMYTRNRISIRNRADRDAIFKLFTIQNLLSISKSFPSTLQSLQDCIESSVESELWLKKYGKLFLAEIQHYVAVYKPVFEPLSPRPSNTFPTEEFPSDDDQREDSLGVESIIKENNVEIIGNTGAQFSRRRFCGGYYKKRGRSKKARNKK